MYKLIRYFNQNRRRILLIVLIVVFIIIIIQLLNFLSKNENDDSQDVNIIQNQSNTTQNSSINPNTNEENSSTDENKDTNDRRSEVSTDRTITSGDKKDAVDLKKETDIIGTFLDYCNESNIEDAYNMLSQDCKDAMFQDMESFNTIYYSTLFKSGKRNYTIENWNDSTYKITFKDDNILATGRATNGNTDVDYITVTKENDEDKLNVNSFIEKKEIDRGMTNTDINLNINIKCIYQYMQYSDFDIEFSNESDDTIQIDSLTNPYTMYILDNEEAKHYANTTGLPTERLTLTQKQEKQVKMRFYNKYSSDKTLDKMVFSDITIYSGDNRGKYSLDIEL